jgi:uncharacterized membrane protein YozB (DUF420 family)
MGGGTAEVGGNGRYGVGGYRTLLIRLGIIAVILAVVLGGLGSWREGSAHDDTAVAVLADMVWDALVIAVFFFVAALAMVAKGYVHERKRPAKSNRPSSS